MEVEFWFVVFFQDLQISFRRLLSLASVVALKLRCPFLLCLLKDVLFVFGFQKFNRAVLRYIFLLNYPAWDKAS